MASAKRSTGAVGQRQIAIGDLNRRMCLAAQLTNRLDDLGQATPVSRMVVAQPAAIGVERQLANA